MQTSTKSSWRVKNTVESPLKPMHGLKLTAFMMVRSCPACAFITPQEPSILQDQKWSPDRRSIHEPDSHLRAKRCRSLRLSEPVAGARCGVEASAAGVDALELTRDAGTDRSPLGCSIRYAESSLAKRIDYVRRAILENCRKTGLSEAEIRSRFWPAIKTAENLPGGLVRPCFHQRSVDLTDAEPRHAGVCRPARLDDRTACP
jgi:hypothetical protein